ncbi:MAG: hypothetical protein A2Y25_01320 [Candidatus Melainabacteria bacterium GWF2_37_15]|nr:MAG: hypothetical protein A2Y25_01320 [Candidatus Melainabacteria bacterium GWF2_37_15]
MLKSPKYVLITGASSGIGKSTAQLLEQKGFTVFGGGREYLDINDDDSIQKAFIQISEKTGENGLYGLVNNAGIAVAGPIEFLPIEKLRLQLETNVIGQVKITQAFLPLIRKAKGRIINISSIAGYTAFPFKGAYCASKHAIEAISDSLRRELLPWGIQVSVIEPGIIRTPIWDKSFGLLQETICEMNEDAQKYYGNYCEPLIERTRKKVDEIAIPPEHVAEAVFKALNDRNPRTRYRVGKDAQFLNLIKLLPDKILDKLICSHLKVNKK